MFWERELTTAISASRGSAVVLLAGLALLGLALLALMLTRWGQVKPLSKCIVLSVFAHLLLIAGAYRIGTLAESPPPREETVRVVLIAPDELAPPHEPEPQPSVVEPWTDVPLPEPLASVQQEPPRMPADEAPLAQRSQGVPPSLESPVFPELAAPATELPSPPEMATARPEPAPAPSAPAELPADVLAAARQMETVDDLPSLISLPESLPSPVHDDKQPVGGPADESAEPAAESAAEPAAEPPLRPARQDRLPLTPVPMASVAPIASPPVREAGLRRPADGSPLPAIYRGRNAHDRNRIAIRNGGTAETEAAVQAALVWLAANQESDGRWNAARHGAGRETQVLGHDRGGAGAQADTGISGLAILAFLGTGQSHFDGEHRETVQRGLSYLLRSQAPDGNLAGEARLFARMYCHGMAALAISEAFAMTGDQRLKPFVERAVAYTVRAQNTSDGGWRYVPGDAGDMSQFGWQLMALRSAQLAGVPLPAATEDGMRRFMHSVRAGRHGGLAGYRPYAPPTATMTAEALVCRLLLEPHARDAATGEAVELLMQEPPQAGMVNLYYWYYATMAMFQIGGPDWQTWNEQLQTRLLATRETSGPAAGSWPPDCIWAGYGGRIYSTALAALCLEVYYRYLPILEQPPPPPNPLATPATASGR